MAFKTKESKGSIVADHVLAVFLNLSACLLLVRIHTPFKFVALTGAKADLTHRFLQGERMELVCRANSAHMPSRAGNTWCLSNSLRFFAVFSETKGTVIRWIF